MHTHDCITFMHSFPLRLSLPLPCPPSPSPSPPPRSTSPLYISPSLRGGHGSSPAGDASRKWRGRSGRRVSGVPGRDHSAASLSTRPLSSSHASQPGRHATSHAPWTTSTSNDGRGRSGDDARGNTSDVWTYTQPHACSQLPSGLQLL